MSSVISSSTVRALFKSKGAVQRHVEFQHIESQFELKFRPFDWTGKKNLSSWFQRKSRNYQC
jgi:hypothetical protein